jgi:hypothetical protein
MEGKTNQRKWYVIGFLTLGVALVYIIIAIISRKEDWINAWLSIGGTILPVSAAVLIMLYTKECSDKSTSEQINHLTTLTNQQIKSYQEESKKQITHIQEATEKQIKVIQESTEKQMNHVSELTNKHINTYKDESEKQIKNVRDSTNTQIDSFVKQTNEITSRLEETAEILAVISKINEKMLDEEKELRKIEEEKKLEREAETLRQTQIIQATLNRYKPFLQFRLYEDMQNLFWKYTYVHIHNGGGDATTIQFLITFENTSTNQFRTFEQSFSNIGRNKHVTFQTGRTKHLIGFNKVTVKVSAWDINQINYTSHLWWERNNDIWNRIDFVENNNLLLS